MASRYERKAREWCYKYQPYLYGISCDLCGGTNITWSEFEHEIWCYDCQKDTPGNAGIFDGPIPVQLTKMLIGNDCFDRIEIKSGKIIKMEDYINPETKS